MDLVKILRETEKARKRLEREAEKIKRNQERETEKARKFQERQNKKAMEKVMDYTAEPLNNIDKAYYAFTTFGVGENIPTNYKKSVTSFLAKFKTRIEKLKGIADLCGDEKTAKALYVKSMALFWAGAKYRNEAIEVGNEYLLLGKDNLVWENRDPEEILCINGYPNKFKNLRLCEILRYLGDAYRGEKEYEKAEGLYKICQEIEPYSPVYPLNISKIYRSQKNYSKAVEILEDATKNPYIPHELTIVLYEQIAENKEIMLKDKIRKQKKTARKAEKAEKEPTNK